MAIGDIVSVVVNPTSWQAIVTVSGMGVSGNYNMGFGQYNSINSPNTPKIKFTVVSSGYDDLGNPTTLQRFVYGTKCVRLPYPNNAILDETGVAGNVQLRIALSDFIYQKDNPVTADFLTGFYFSGALANTQSLNTPVTNNSELAYPKVIANWTWPSFDVISADTFKLRCCAFHRSAQSGRPVRVVKFTAFDTGNNTVTGFVTSPTIDSSMPDAVKVIEYVANLSSSSLIQGSPITGNFIAYPWYGDTGSLINTNDGINTGVDPYYKPISLLCDKNNTYGTTVAIVNQTTGNNNVASVVDLASFDVNNPPPAYTSIGAAATGIKNYNNSIRGRNDIGLGKIYLQSGNHGFIGQTITSTLFGNTPSTYLTITSYPNESRENVIITGGLGSTTAQNKIKFSNIFINQGIGTLFNANNYLWFDNCIINITGTTAINQAPLVSYTNNHIKEIRQGMDVSNSTQRHHSLIRGNIFDNYSRNIITYTCIGNLRTGKIVANADLFKDFSGVNINFSRSTQNTILAYNKTFNYSGNTPIPINYGSVPIIHGAAIIQNIFEKNFTIGFSVADLGSTATNVNPFENILIWHNSFIGERQQMCYNDDGSAPYFRGINWHTQNNVTENYGFKSDTFTPPDGNRTGNWSHNYMVGSAGNGLIKVDSSIFEQNFMGLNTLTGHYFTTGQSFYGYVAPGAARLAAGTGHGNYNILSSSPLIGLPLNQLLPYDIDGNARSTTDAAGAYTFTTVSLSDGTILRVIPSRGILNFNDSFGLINKS